jgi:hypothetical protein
MSWRRRSQRVASSAARVVEAEYSEVEPGEGEG